MERIKKSYKKTIALLLVMVMTMSMFAGCGAGSFPKTASAMALSYGEQLKSVENYKLTGTATVNVGFAQAGDEASALGSMSLPVNVSFTNKVDGKGHMMFDLKMDISFLGQSNSREMQIYMEYSDTESTLYMHDVESDTWTKQSVKIREEDVDFFRQQDDVLNEWFDKAEFEDTDDGHVVTQKLSDIIGSSAFKEILNKAMESVKEAGKENNALNWFSNPDELISHLNEKLGNAAFVYTFDDDKLLTNFKTKDVSFSEELDTGALFGGTSGSKMKFDLSVDINADYSDYGKVNESECIISDEDKAKAKDSGASVDMNDLLGGSTT